MSIENKTWVTGEVITADDLNKITPLVVNITTTGGDLGSTVYTANKTFKQIIDAFEIGREVICFVITTGAFGNMYRMYNCKVNTSTDEQSPAFQMVLVTEANALLGKLSFSGASENDYPVATMGHS